MAKYKISEIALSDSATQICKDIFGEKSDLYFLVTENSNGVGQVFSESDPPACVNVPPDEWAVLYPEIDSLVEVILLSDNLPRRLQNRAERYKSGKMGLASKIRLLESEGHKIEIKITTTTTI